jgi:hypothetical protein
VRTISSLAEQPPLPAISLDCVVEYQGAKPVAKCMFSVDAHVATVLPFLPIRNADNATQIQPHLHPVLQEALCHAELAAALWCACMGSENTQTSAADAILGATHPQAVAGIPYSECAYTALIKR